MNTDTTKNTPVVVCLGILVADVIGRPVDAYPAPGTLQLVESIAPHIGGCAANTGIGLQTLGVQTLVAGKVGRDGFGAFARGELRRAGVATHIVEDEKAPTSATMVMVRSDAERAFLHCIGANATFEARDFDVKYLDGARLLHIAGHGLMPRFDGPPCAHLLHSAKARGLQTCLDTAGAPDAHWAANLRTCLPYLDFFVPSLHEAQALFPGAATPGLLATHLLDAGVGCVAIKMGERGSYVSNWRQSHLVPPFKVDAVDATGAGDAFAAGFVCGVLHQESLLECARLGNACGALCSAQIGTIAGYRSLSETQMFMQKAGGGQS